MKKNFNTRVVIFNKWLFLNDPSPIISRHIYDQSIIIIIISYQDMSILITYFLIMIDIWLI